MKTKDLHLFEVTVHFIRNHKFRGQNSLRGKGRNTHPKSCLLISLNHIYLFNYIILLIFAFIYFIYHLDLEEFHFGFNFAIRDSSIKYR